MERIYRNSRRDRDTIMAALDAYGWPPPDKVDEHIDRMIAAINAVIDRDRLNDLSL